jgi:protein tyrosine phosphatase (PTP) superfamily phosphohydrolase (DUF442 family)
MTLTRNRSLNVVGSLLTLLLLSVVSFAQEAAPQQQALTKESFPQVRIKNFGQMDERFYRGGQPKEDQYEALKALGINTIIDLQAEPKEYERRIVESLGMRYVNIPMVAKKYPKPEDVAAFLKLADDPSTGKFYLHCAGGRHRTGVMGAVYRFNKYGWGYEQVYREMKDFDFYTAWGHGAFKDFVQDYWQQFQAAKSSAPAVPAASTEALFAGANRK